LPDKDDDVCQLLVKFMRMMVLFWRLMKFMFEEGTGEITAEWKEQLCSASSCKDEQE